MPVIITYSNNTNKENLTNLILFSNEKFEVKYLKKFLSKNDFSYINDLLKTSELKKKILVFEISSKKKIILVSVKNNLSAIDVESLGAELYGRINQGKNPKYSLNSNSINSKQKNFLGHFLHGLK